MQEDFLTLGIDLGTSGVRIAIINNSKDLIYTDSINYQNGLTECKDWQGCCTELITNIPINIRSCLTACSIAGTSGTLIACKENGDPIGKAIPYDQYFENKNKEIQSLLIGSNSKRLDSLERGLYLIDLYGYDLLLRHQADWISGWLLGNWTWGEEGNNIKFGWDLINKCWPKFFEKQNWLNTLPEIIPSGKIISKISQSQASFLGLPIDLLLIAGTTDSNAAVIAASPKENEGICILGSTIVIKKFAKEPILEKGITNHLVSGKWLIGGASNTGGIILKKFFSENQIEELSQQIDPNIKSNIKLIPLPSKGERFPINDPNLQPILNPRPISDALYIHAIFEGLAEIENQGWQRLKNLGLDYPKRIITMGKGAKNIQWQRIRERVIKIPIKRNLKPPAIGAAIIALKAIKENI